MTDYSLLSEQLAALSEGVPVPVSVLANAAALLWETLPACNWAGFYLLRGDTLYLGPFQGKVACVAIPMGRGVCGTAAARDETQRVPDVHAFPGHIACDGRSQSEIVVPVHDADGQLIAVFDVDSDKPAAFDDTDQRWLETILKATFG